MASKVPRSSRTPSIKRVPSNPAYVTYVIPEIPDTFRCALTLGYSLHRSGCKVTKVVMVSPKMVDGEELLPEYRSLMLYYDEFAEVSTWGKEDVLMHGIDHFKLYSLALVDWSAVKTLKNKKKDTFC